MSEITVKKMFEAGIHFGHQPKYWNPKMAPYIFGKYNNLHIINLDESLNLYLKAIKFITNIISNKGIILFVGTKKSAKELVQIEAMRAQMPYINYRWLGGTLTNYKTIRKSLKDLHRLEEMKKESNFDHVSKKEGIKLNRQLLKLQNSLDGIKKMKGLPDALFVIDTNHEHIAIKEAQKLKIPVIAIVDTNSNPEGLDYIIPGNDDSRKSITFYLNHIVNSIIESNKSKDPKKEDEYIEIIEEKK
jgi:small subunit ribosomal protein S2